MMRFVEALVSVPSLAADESWTGDPTLVERFPAILDEAIEQAGPGGWQIALMAGDADRARGLAATVEGRSALPIGLVIDAWTGDEEALSEVRSIADARPDDLTALGWAARLSSRSGDEDGADRYRRQARFVNDGGFVGNEVRVEGREPQQSAVTGAHTEMYGQMLYRRPLPADLIAPGLPRLVYLVP